MYAETIDEDFVVDVYVPPDSEEVLPVIYLTDGNIMFSMVLSTMRVLQVGFEMPRPFWLASAIENQKNDCPCAFGT